MVRYGLIGYPLGHSYSRAHFTRKFREEGLDSFEYLNYEISSIDQVTAIIREQEDLAGFNVTIPYKTAVLPILDRLDETAQRIGAVNTVTIRRPGGKPYLTGYNTDIIGFKKSLLRMNPLRPIRALLFGTGGSSLAVARALEELEIPYLRVSRTIKEGCLTYRDINPSRASSHHLWINCTPVGMYPESAACLPLPYSRLTPGHFLYDLVYNPEITLFLQKGKDAGATVMNGKEMLFEQAEASWEIWMRERNQTI
jgi:shikimate dehydrogenase